MKNRLYEILDTGHMDKLTWVTSSEHSEGDRHVLCQSGEKRIAYCTVQFQPGILVNQTHRLHRNLKQHLDIYDRKFNK